MTDLQLGFTRKPLGVKIVEKAMFLFLVLFPFGLVSYRALSAFGLLPYGRPVASFTYWLPVVFISGVILWAFTSIPETLDNKRVNALLLLIFTSALIFRVMAAYIFNPVPIQDFNMIFQNAANGSFSKVMQAVPYNAMYSLVMRIFVAVFGAITFPILVFQSINAAFTTLIIYAICIEATENKKLGAVAACFYAFNPALILYSTIISCENLSPLLFSISILFFIRSWKYRKTSLKKSIISTLVAALFLSFTNLFKPIGVLMLIAFSATEILINVIPAITALVKSRNDKSNVKFLWINIAVSLILIFGSVAMNTAVFNVGEILRNNIIGVGEENPSFTSQFGRVAYRGLSPKAGGLWNQEVNIIVQDVYDAYDEAQADAILLQKLKDEIKEIGLPAFVEMLKNKMSISWASEYMPGYWATNKDADVRLPSVYDTPVGNELLHEVPSIFTVFMCVGAALGFLILLLSKREHTPLEVFSACLFGVVFLSFMIMEAQERYKSTFMPLLSIVSAMGYLGICNYGYCYANKLLQRIKLSKLGGTENK